MKPSSMLRTTSLLAAVLLLSSTARSQEPAASRPADVYSRVALSELETVDGTWPVALRERWLSNESSAPPTTGVFPPPIEGFLTRRDGAIHLVARSPVEAEVTALFMLPLPGGGTTRLRVRVPPAKVAQGTRKEFLEAAREHYAQLVFFRPPGAAWFRHRLDAIEAELGTEQKPGDDRPRRSLVVSRRDRSGEIEETYDFFSAGRAVSENLRLDRSLAPIDGGEPTIPIETAQGHRDEGVRLEGGDREALPRQGPARGPHPGGPARRVLPEPDRARRHAGRARGAGRSDRVFGRPSAPRTPASARSTSGSSVSSSGTSRPVFAAASHPSAITGSDPYFATGTDVAVLLECEPAALRASTLAEVQAATRCAARSGSTHSRIRTVSSFVGAGRRRRRRDELARAAEAHRGRRLRGSCRTSPASPEYVFFRDRYRRWRRRARPRSFS